MKKLRKPIKFLIITNALVLVSAAMLGPIYAIFVSDIGGDLMDASLAGAIFALSAGITTILSGKYSDKLNNELYVIILGYIIMGIGFFMYTLVDSIAFLFFVQVIIGLGEAIYAPAFDSLYGKNIHKNHRGYEWGIWESMNYFTLSIGAFIGGIIVTYFGFEVVFYIMGFLCLFSSFYLHRLFSSLQKVEID